MAKEITLGSATAARWVFVPEMPTPNGRLHLGHMSGPYLRADIIARYLRLRGAEACVVSGSDVYESHVELASAQRGEPEQNVANYFHKRIMEEFSALDIRLDVYVNPLDPEFSEGYMDANVGAFQELRRREVTAVLAEKILRSESRGRHLAGCWLSGECPSCGAKSGSYLCEACGTEYSPQDLHNVVVGDELGRVEADTVPSTFLRVRRTENIWRHLALAGVPPDFARIVERYLRERGDRVRLTNPSPWGIDSGRPGQVLFTYTALYFFSVYCGALLARRKGWPTNPFETCSDALTIASFGIDNAIPYLLSGVAVAEELEGYRPFDYFLTNHFYQLEGKKFSTSRRHLVCATSLIEAGVSADLLRYFLAKVNPERGPRSFAPEEFVRTCQELQQSLGSDVARALDTARNGAGAPPDNWRELFEDACQRQACALSFPAPSLRECVEVVDRWVGERAAMAEALDATATHWWLTGLAVLAAPIMPKFAADLWRGLCREGEPSPANVSTPAGGASVSGGWTPFPDVSLARIDACVSREAESRNDQL